MKYTDRSILINVMDHLLWDDRIDASNITVKVIKGVIILSGSVPTYAAKTKIPSLIMPLHGVVFIHDHTTVEHATDPLTDENLHSNILKTFDCHTDINPDDIDVFVNHGSVTLKGVVGTLWMKSLVENVVSHVWGVMDIANHIRVVNGKKVTDKTIRNTIHAAMDRSALVDKNEIMLTVNHGTVTLSGAVPSWNAYLAALESTLHTQGVTRIKNYLIIDPTPIAGKSPIRLKNLPAEASLHHKNGSNIKNQWNKEKRNKLLSCKAITSPNVRADNAG